jgi:hypothetical protein
MSQTDSIVARIMSIRNGMILDADAEALIRREIGLDLPQSSSAVCPYRGPFGCRCEPGECKYRPALSQSSPVTETEHRKERISMAREICLHRGENPNAVDRGGNEGWEKYEPLAGACIREAERLFALRAMAPVADNTATELDNPLLYHYASPPPEEARSGGHAPTPAAVTDAQIEAGCKARHSPQGWGRRLNQPNMAAWVTSHREEMRMILTAALADTSTLCKSENGK